MMQHVYKVAFGSILYFFYFNSLNFFLQTNNIYIIMLKYYSNLSFQLTDWIPDDVLCTSDILQKDAVA